MKNDIDFDELDRAVNSLMGGAATTRSADDTPKATTLSISTTLQPDETPTYDRLGEVAKKIGSETFIAENDTSIVKNLGEIARDDSVASPVLEDAELVSVVQQEEEVVEPTPTPNPEPSIVSMPVQPPSASVIPAAQRPSSGRFMDVVHPSSDMKVSVPPPRDPAVEPTPNPEPLPIVAAPVQELPAVDVELSSPFLPDAKVEKRPLGDPTAPAKELDYIPNDISEEIVAINSEAVTTEEASKSTQNILDATKIEPVVSEVDQQLQAIESAQVQTVSGDEAAALRAVESVDASVVPAADPQGAIFDVEEYHQPLAHPAKQKSGWGVVIVIVVIIVLAAAVGAGAYFLLGLGN